MLLMKLHSHTLKPGRERAPACSCHKTTGFTVNTRAEPVSGYAGEKFANDNPVVASAQTSAAT
jgi:hypothetical protein